MKVWLDAQLSPRLARWLSERFGLEVACMARTPGSARPPRILEAARTRLRTGLPRRSVGRPENAAPEVRDGFGIAVVGEPEAQEQLAVNFGGIRRDAEAQVVFDVGDSPAGARRRACDRCLVRDPGARSGPSAERV